MAEVEIGDPIIKLFGKTIALPLNHLDLPSDSKFLSSETSVLKAGEKVGIFIFYFRLSLNSVSAFCQSSSRLDWVSFFYLGFEYWIVRFKRILGK